LKSKFDEYISKFKNEEEKKESIEEIESSFYKYA